MGVELELPKPTRAAASYWHEFGPSILGTYGHPSHIRAVYPIAAGMRLIELINGTTPKVIFYDTVDLPVYAKQPFLIKLDSGQEVGTKLDFLGAGDYRARDQVDCNKVYLALERFAKKKVSIVGGILGQLGISDQRTKRRLGDLMNERASFLLNMVVESLGELDKTATIDELLGTIHWRIVKSVLGISQDYQTLEAAHGIPTSIYSMDQQYLKTLRHTLGLLLVEYGPALLLNLATPGKNHVLAEVAWEGQRAFMTVDTDGNFATKPSGGSFRVSAQRAMELIQNGLPYSRVENLAVYGLGKTLHYGSEYGERETTLKALGYEGEVLEACRKMRIGQDKEQGVYWIKGLTSYAGYFLFGEHLKKIWQEAINGTLPKIETVTELRDFVVKLNLGV